MLFESLHHLESKPGRLLMFPRQWSVNKAIDETRYSNERALLYKARTEYRAKLVPITQDSFTKHLEFNQTQYSRVLTLDSDSVVRQHMDELFTLPSAPVAMPCAYRLPAQLSSQLILIEPSAREWHRRDFDMEIVNALCKESCIVLPHRRYDLLAGEFRSERHEAYLGSEEEGWNPDKVFAEAKFVHFSNYPHPKLWIAASEQQTRGVWPKCKGADGMEVVVGCREREIWLRIYRNFRERRGDVCGKR
ncbi:glycosyltransferase family 8 protein [Patellaria atrata CBS 101060]|uniref:Glycosyltransferase family 8 protein n=1 Tax=Patellaria atrata CBS 101060 TaxID=1346257 RepID=A0A9P4S8Q7_9PEZI|nr:glycosyltransferase family 8 protein [Patellaria atrata CBS 101060]